MARDNENVVAPDGTVAKEAKQSSGKWRNLVAIGAIVAAGAGYIGFGIGLKYEQLPGNTASGNRVQSNIVVPLMVHEGTPGAFANGGTGDVITGITKDGSLLVQSGAILLGPDGAPNISLSGSTLDVNGTMSGRTLFLNGAPAQGIWCKKADGSFGYRTVSATGTIVAGSCQ